MSLRQLLYLSDATRCYTRDDLDRLMAFARPRNAERNITGLLFYSAGHFVQLLEGPPAAVDELMSIIEQDDRHRNVRVLLSRPTEARLFEHWEMGLLDLELCSETHRRKLRRLIDVANADDTGDDGTPLALVLLAEFCMLLPAPA